MQNYIKKLLLLHSILLAQVWCPGSSMKIDYENSLNTQSQISCKNNLAIVQETVVNNDCISNVEQSSHSINSLIFLLTVSLIGLSFYYFKSIHNIHNINNINKKINEQILKIQLWIYCNLRSYKKYRHNECYKLFYTIP